MLKVALRVSQDFFVFLGLICSFSINTGNSKRDFESTNISCSSDESGKIWTKSYEPAYHVADNKCTGYVSVPRIVLCNVTAPSGIQRLCNCITQGIFCFLFLVSTDICLSPISAFKIFALKVFF